MHAVLLNQFYPPSQAPTGRLLHGLAAGLHQRGHRVTVVASPGAYAGGARSDSCPQREDGIAVRWTGPRGRHRSGVLLKALDYLRFFAAAGRTLQRLAPVPDVVVCMTTPPFCGLMARRLKRRQAVPYVLWCMDLYPEALAAGGFPGAGQVFLRRLERSARREREGADRVIALGPDMAGRLRASAPEARIGEIPVWSDVRATPAALAQAGELRRARGWGEDEVILMYSGNIGRAHAVEGIVQLAAQWRREGRRARVVICGRGPARAAWELATATLVEWIAPVSEDLVAAHLLSADAHLCSQKAGWSGIVVPSKYPVACSLGRPVVFAGPADSAVAGWIREDDTGWILPCDAPVGVERVASELCDARLRNAKAARAQAQAGRLFSRDTNIERLVHDVEQAAGRQPEAPQEPLGTLGGDRFGQRTP